MQRRLNEILNILKLTGSKNWDGDAEYPATYLTYRRLDLDNAIRSALSRKHKTRTSRVRPQAESSQPTTKNAPLFNFTHQINFD